MKRTSNFAAAVLAAVAATTMASNAEAQAESTRGLLMPRKSVVDGSIPQTRKEEMSLAARRYYTFWNTGDVNFAKAALASDFVDRDLPPGRPQGPAGPEFASKNFRAAVPDLKLDVEEMMLVGDRVVGRLRFTGHFTGTFGAGSAARRGDGRSVDFIAVDIYRVEAGRIAENWHLEDNLTLLQQLGVVSP